MPLRLRCEYAAVFPRSLPGSSCPPCYGFRPKRRAHDAIAEIHHFGTRGYRWVLDADIEAAFDNLSHCFAMERVRARVTDKRVLGAARTCPDVGAGNSRGGGAGQDVPQVRGAHRARCAPRNPHRHATRWGCDAGSHGSEWMHQGRFDGDGVIPGQCL
jgi:hypothetical protein